MPPGYALALTSRAQRALAEELPEPIAFAAHAFVTGPLLDRPRRIGKELRPPYQGIHSARMGTYRVLYRIDEDERTVIVLAVGLRSDIYRSR